MITDAELKMIINHLTRAQFKWSKIKYLFCCKILRLFTVPILKVFKRKLISVLFEILKDKDDYLDATMITREIKSRNPKP